MLSEEVVEKQNGTVHCSLYNATRIIVRNSDNIELACLKKEEDRKEKNILAALLLSGLVLL